LQQKKYWTTRQLLILLQLHRAKFSEGFNVNLDFLAKDPSEWENDDSFQSAHQVLSKVAAVNDFAERGVSLIQDYNHILTKDEEQRQFLLQVVEFHRQHFPV